MAQDLPPTGGYEPVQYKVTYSWTKSIDPPSNNQQRNLPARGFRPSYYLFAVGIIMTYGMYKAGQGIRERKYVSK